MTNPSLRLLDALVENSLGDRVRVVKGDATFIQQAQKRAKIDEPRRKDLTSKSDFDRIAKNSSYAVTFDKKSKTFVASVDNRTMGVWDPSVGFGWIFDGDAGINSFSNWCNYLAESDNLAMIHNRVFWTRLNKYQDKLKFKVDGDVVAIDKSSLEALAAELNWRVVYWPHKRSGDRVQASMMKSDGTMMNYTKVGEGKAWEIKNIVMPGDAEPTAKEFYSIDMGGYNNRA